jgi:hypothetical protein
MITTNTNTMTRTEKINGFTISLEQSNGLYFVKIMPGQMLCRGKRNQETSYAERNSQDARDRVQAFKEYAKCNPL